MDLLALGDKYRVMIESKGFTHWSRPKVIIITCIKTPTVECLARSTKGEDIEQLTRRLTHQVYVSRTEEGEVKIEYEKGEDLKGAIDEILKDEEQPSTPLLTEAIAAEPSTEDDDDEDEEEVYPLDLPNLDEVEELWRERNEW
jgi:hypothetical protein